jgi:hypothetical protein
MRLAEHEARIGERRGVYRVLVGDGRIILRWIFRKQDVGVLRGSSWLRIGTGGGQL